MQQEHSCSYETRKAYEPPREDCRWFHRACLAALWAVAALNGLLRYFGML